MSMWKRLQMSTRMREYGQEWAIANRWGLKNHLGIIRFFRGHPEKRARKIVKRAIVTAINRGVR